MWNVCAISLTPDGRCAVSGVGTDAAGVERGVRAVSAHPENTHD